MSALVFQIRRDTLSGWALSNPTLKSGEFGLETDTGQLKIGNGTAAWTALPYLSSGGGGGGGGGPVSASIIPTLNNTFDLGSPGSAFRHLYVSGSSIFLGSTRLSSDAAGNLAVTNAAGRSTLLSGNAFTTSSLVVSTINGFPYNGGGGPTVSSFNTLGASTLTVSTINGLPYNGGGGPAVSSFNTLRASTLTVSTINGLPYTGSGGATVSTFSTLTASTLTANSASVPILTGVTTINGQPYVTGGTTGGLVSASFTPTLNNTYDLGTATSTFRRLYISTINDLPFTGGGGGGPAISSFEDLTASTLVVSTINSHLLPSQDLTFDLGSPTAQWRSLYVGASTIYIGTSRLSSDTAGNLVFTNAAGQSTISNLTTKVMTENFSVAVSRTGKIIYTYEGTTWVDANTPSGLYNSVAWNGSYWLAAAAAGRIIRSADGINWEFQQGPDLTSATAIAWNGSYWMVSGIGTSTGGSVTQPLEGGSVSLPLEGGGAYPSTEVNGVCISPDAIRWTTLATTTSVANSIAWNGEYWLIATDAGVFTSYDGSSWIAPVASPAANSPCKSAAWNGRWVVTAAPLIAPDPGSIEPQIIFNKANAIATAAAAILSATLSISSNPEKDGAPTWATLANGVLTELPNSQARLTAAQLAVTTALAAQAAADTAYANAVSGYAAAALALANDPTNLDKQEAEVAAAAAQEAAQSARIAAEAAVTEAERILTVQQEEKASIIVQVALSAIAITKTDPTAPDIAVQVSTAKTAYSLVEPDPNFFTETVQNAFEAANSEFLDADNKTAAFFESVTSLADSVPVTALFEAEAAAEAARLASDAATAASANDPSNLTKQAAAAAAAAAYVAAAAAFAAAAAAVFALPSITNLGNETILWIGQLDAALKASGVATAAALTDRISIITSSDGTNWTAVSTPLDGLTVTSVAWNGVYWLAVSSDTDTAIYSTDGVAWTSRPIPLLRAYSLTWNGSLWIVAGDSVRSYIVTSPDGSTWSQQNTTFLTYGIVAVSRRILTPTIPINRILTENFSVVTGASGLVYSYDAVTWVPPPAFDSFLFNAVAWNGSYWLGAGTSSGSVIKFSANGITWSTIEVVTPLNGVSGGGVGTVNTIAWNGIIWVAGGKSPVGQTIMTSPDGQIWTIRSSPFDPPPGGAAGGEVKSVAWNGTLWVAVGRGTNAIATSTDGITWIPQYSSSFDPPGQRPATWLSVANTVAWNGSYWLVGGRAGLLAAGQDGKAMATSTDGVTWDAVPTTPFNFTDAANPLAVQSIAWNGTYWMAVGLCQTNQQDPGAFTRVATSTDGSTWTTCPSPFDSATANTVCYGVTWNGSVWIVTGQSPTVSIATSADGNTWTVRPNSTRLARTVASRRAPLYTIGKSLSQPPPTEGFTVAGGVGTANSYDGVVWQKPVTEPAGYMKGLAWNGDHWMAVYAPGNATYLSSDGKTWSLSPASLSGLGQLNSQARYNNIVYNGRIWLATGTTIAYSSDGVNWAEVSWPPNQMPFFNGYCTAAAWNGRYWLAVGFRCYKPPPPVALPTGYIAVVQNRGVIMTSIDGISWIEIDLPNNPFTGDRRRGRGTKRKISGGTAPVKLTRKYGRPRKHRPAVFDVAWNGSIWAAVGSDGTSARIVTSRDGLTWTETPPLQTIFTNVLLNGIVWNGVEWLVHGNSLQPGPNPQAPVPVIRITSDLSNWPLTYPVAMDSRFAIEDVVWNGGRWIALYGDGTMATLQTPAIPVVPPAPWTRLYSPLATGGTAARRYGLATIGAGYALATRKAAPPLTLRPNTRTANLILSQISTYKTSRTDDLIILSHTDGTDLSRATVELPASAVQGQEFAITIYSPNPSSWTGNLTVIAPGSTTVNRSGAYAPPSTIAHMKFCYVGDDYLQVGEFNHMPSGTIDAPSIATATVTSDGRLSLTWSAPTYTGITGYRVSVDEITWINVGNQLSTAGLIYAGHGSGGGADTIVVRVQAYANGILGTPAESESLVLPPLPAPGGLTWTAGTGNPPSGTLTWFLLGFSDVIGYVVDFPSAVSPPAGKFIGNSYRISNIGNSPAGGDPSTVDGRTIIAATVRGVVKFGGGTISGPVPIPLPYSDATLPTGLSGSFTVGGTAAENSLQIDWNGDPGDITFIITLTSTWPSGWNGAEWDSATEQSERTFVLQPVADNTSGAFQTITASIRARGLSNQPSAVASVDIVVPPVILYVENSITAVPTGGSGVIISVAMLGATSIVFTGGNLTGPGTTVITTPSSGVATITDSGLTSGQSYSYIATGNCSVNGITTVANVTYGQQ